MYPPILKEYYMVNGKPVVMIMTNAREGMQSWTTDLNSREMKRDYSLMNDIVRGDHEGKITEVAFNAYCFANNISTVIPPKSISTSFHLAQKGQAPVKNVPFTDRQYTGRLYSALNIA